MNCRHFKPQVLFQVEVLRHMVGRFLPYREKQFLKRVFDALDEEKDGELEFHEFVQQFHVKFGMQLSVDHMRKMVASMDLPGTKTGGDGLIQFTEFLVAASDKISLLTSDNIHKEFKYLDADQDGVINANDIEKFMYGLEGRDGSRGDLADFEKLLQEIKENNIQGELEDSYVGAVIDYTTF